MRIVALGVLAITILGVPASARSADEAGVVEKVGSTYSLAMEGMT
jgi:hypothetical protein